MKLTSDLCTHVTCRTRTCLACPWTRKKGKGTGRLEVKAHLLKPHSTSWLTPSSDPMSRDSDKQTLSQYMGHYSGLTGGTYSKSPRFGKAGSNVKKGCSLLKVTRVQGDGSCLSGDWGPGCWLCAQVRCCGPAWHNYASSHGWEGPGITDNDLYKSRLSRRGSGLYKSGLRRRGRAQLPTASSHPRLRNARL